MNPKEALLSETQLDFLREMMNIGAGNAATALSKMLQTDVNMDIPKVQVLPGQQVYAFFGDPSLGFLGVKMRMVGDVSGDLYFMVRDEQKRILADLVKKGIPGSKRKNAEMDHSALTETGNIIAGVYLAAIHGFCKLTIYHTLPVMSVDMIQSLLDESLINISRQTQAIFLVENEFIILEDRIRTFFVLIPSVESVKILVDSIEQVRIAYGFE
jgi:chemotaxis protein CheC